MRSVSTKRPRRKSRASSKRKSRRKSRTKSRRKSRTKSRTKLRQKSSRKSRRKSRRKPRASSKREKAPSPYAEFGFKDAGWVIYEKEGCGYCQKAKELLSPYNPKVIDGPSNLPEIEKKIGTEFKTWPKIFKGDKFIGGYNDLIKTLK